MMNDMMHGGMMWGMGILWLLVIVVLLLAAAALVKYLFFNIGTAQVRQLRAVHHAVSGDRARSPSAR